jgi:AraC-like DNA-binding protein
LFKLHGGVARYIKKRRLLRVFEALSDPQGRETIATLAAEYGFEDPSSFGRAFRREFGRSAGDVRASALANVTLRA